MHNQQQYSFDSNSNSVNSPVTERPWNDDRQWLVEFDFEKPGKWQMARDEELARQRMADTALPNILRLYSWAPPALSIGYQQKMEAIALEECARRGIDVVRRPSGGRAVLHKNELTYAVILRAAPEHGIYAVHNHIVNALLQSFKDLGPEYRSLLLTDRSSDREFGETYKVGTLTNAACFASTARHEVTSSGKKVVGSAQRRFGEVVLQHGSILLTNDHLELPELLALSVDDRIRMRSLLERSTASLSDVFARPISIEEAAMCVATDFVSHICKPFD